MVRPTENTHLSVKDMTKLVTVYDAVKKLHIAMLGEIVAFPESKGILGALDCVFDVIDSGIRTEYKQLREGEAYQRISCILDNTDMTPGQRAEKLLGMD